MRRFVHAKTMTELLRGQNRTAICDFYTFIAASIPNRLKPDFTYRCLKNTPQMNAHMSCTQASHPRFVRCDFLAESSPFCTWLRIPKEFESHDEKLPLFFLEGPYWSIPPPIQRRRPTDPIHLVAASTAVMVIPRPPCNT